MKRLLALLVALLLLAGCSSPPQWHPVTTEESQQLATTRFHNFDAGTRPFATQLTVQGTQLTLQGWIDFANHVGLAGVTGPTFSPQTLIWWGQGQVALKDGAPNGQPGEIPAPSAAGGWQVRDLEASASNLDALLIFLGALGADRPENPLLLQQAGALWLRKDTVEVGGKKTEVAVFAAPPQESALGPNDPAPTPETATVRLWVDSAGVMHRVEALLGTDWVTIDLGPATGQEMKVSGAGE